MLLGRLGRDADVRQAGASTVANLSLATDRVWKDRDGQLKKETDWHRISVWGKTAENLGPILRKGREVFVEGKLHTREYTDEQGQKKYSTEVRADQVVLVGPRPTDSPSSPRPAPVAAGGGIFDDNDDPLGEF